MRKRITVVGDLMIDVDHIVQRSDEREQRERLIVKESRRRLGAAGAVARMLEALGVDVTLVTVAGNDDRLWIKRGFQKFPFIVGHDGITTRRERFYFDDWTIAGPRLDFNSNTDVSEDDRKLIAGKVLASAPNAVIVCDHARGVVGPGLMEVLSSLQTYPFGKTPIFVDPHPNSDFSIFGGIDSLVMNREEALAATAAEPAPLNIVEKLDADGLFWYRDGWQMEVVPQGAEPALRKYVPSFAREIVDTLGAGDQFVAALAVSRVFGDSMESAIMKASAAAGIQCERRGITPVTWQEIDALLEPKG